MFVSVFALDMHLLDHLHPRDVFPRRWGVRAYPEFARVGRHVIYDYRFGLYLRSERYVRRDGAVRRALARLATVPHPAWYSLDLRVAGEVSLVRGPLRVSAEILARLSELHGTMSIDAHSWWSPSAQQDAERWSDYRPPQLEDKAVLSIGGVSVAFSEESERGDPGSLECEAAMIREAHRRAGDAGSYPIVLEVRGAESGQEILFTVEAVQALAATARDLMIEVYPSEKVARSWYGSFGER